MHPLRLKGMFKNIIPVYQYSLKLLLKINFKQKIIKNKLKLNVKQLVSLRIQS
jgi:hypothetical protein